MALGEVPHWYTRIPHCLLCGEKFSLDSYFHSVIPNKHQHPVLTQPLSFQREGGTITLQDLNVQIHNDPRIKSKNAPSVHRICWMTLVNRPRIHELCDLGLAMTPLVWTGLPQTIFHDRDVLSKAIHDLCNSKDGAKKTTLYELLERCQSLPTELIAIIWDFVTPCTVRCLLSLSATEDIRPFLSSRSGTMSLHGDISVYLTRVLDGTYICGIRQGSKLYGHESNTFTNMLVPLSVTAFVFRFGLYGLRGIDFITEETKPASKGDIPMKDNRFISIIHHQHEVDLEWDSLKISYLSCHTKSNFGHDFLWTSPLQRAHLYPPSPDSFYDWPRQYDYARHPQRFMAYIPLQEDGSRLYGLTAFCSDRGLVGLGTHFYCTQLHSPTTYWYGEQKGCPVHVQFGDSEVMIRLTVFWHRNDCLFNSYLNICIWVTPNHQREFTLGPCIPPPNVDTKTVFSGSRGDILGLYYDKSPGTRFTSLGTICRPHSPNSPNQISSNHSTPMSTSRFSNMIHLLNTSPFDGFASQASLRNITSLKSCYMGSRCTGMLLVYKGGSRCTLGQWYEQDTQAQPDVQEVPFQDGDVLRFHLVQDHDMDGQFLAWVESMSVDTIIPLETETDGTGFLDVAYGDDVVWLFSEYSDIIFRGSD